MKHSEGGMAELATALAEARKGFGQIKKDRTADMGGRFSYQYADLSTVVEATVPKLAEHGLSVLQVPEADGLHTTLLHKSGQWIGGVTPLLLAEKTPRAYGSAVTYARRYALLSILGLAAEDDDGAAAGSQPSSSDGRHETPRSSQLSSPTVAAMSDRQLKFVKWKAGEAGLRDNELLIIASGMVGRTLKTLKEFPKGKVTDLLREIESPSDLGPVPEVQQSIAGTGGHDVPF